MTFDKFVQWARSRGVFLHVTEFDIWVDDTEQGLRRIPSYHLDHIFDQPIAMLQGIDVLDRMHLLVVDAGDPDDRSTQVENYAVWLPIIVEATGLRSVRFTCCEPNSGQSGRLAQWIRESGVSLDSLALY